MLFLSLLLSMGCSKKAMKMDRTTKKVVQNDIPKWVMDPPRNKKEICAVGSYEMKGNISMAQQVSASRARDELSRQLEIHTKSMIKDYIQEGQIEGESFSEEEITSVSKQVTAMTLNGTVPKQRQMMDGAYYTLVCLDVESFADVFDGMNTMGEKIRKGLHLRAQEGFEDLDREVDGMGM